LLDLIEARERVNRDLKRQDDVILTANEHMTHLVNARNELFATWRLINNELANASAEVFPADGVQVQVDAGLPTLDDLKDALIEAERQDMSAHYDYDGDADEPMEGNEVPEPWDG
jgi:hypothetical protein